MGSTTNIGSSTLIATAGYFYFSDVAASCLTSSITTSSGTLTWNEVTLTNDPLWSSITATSFVSIDQFTVGNLNMQ